MGISFELIDEETKVQPNIKVIGVGGAGGNAVANMIKNKLQGVEFIVANTDYRVLELNPAPLKIQLGKKLTKGWGAGGKPEIGKQAAEESEKEIRNMLKDADMVFIAAGMGGGTGTGASPVIANICKDLGILTIAIVTKPFSFEGRFKMKIAEQGLDELKKFVDTLITIPNDKLLLGSPEERVADMFKKADDVLYYAVKGISDLILFPGYINRDFADVKVLMSESGGTALMGMGEARGEGRAETATQMALYSPLLEDISISGAKGALLNISVHPDTFTIHEIQIITGTIAKELHPDAKFYWGVVFDETLEDLLRVTFLATGLEKTQEKEKVIQMDKEVKKKEERQKKSVFNLFDEEILDIPTFLRRNAD